MTHPLNQQTITEICHFANDYHAIYFWLHSDNTLYNFGGTYFRHSGMKFGNLVFEVSSHCCATKTPKALFSLYNF